MMRHTLLALLLAVVALPAAAIDTTLGAGDRICVIQVPGRGDFDDRVARDIRQRLLDALRHRGFQTVGHDLAFEDLRSGEIQADYVVEIASADADAYPSGSVVATTGNVGVDVGVIVSRVAAEFRIYDGRTLQLIENHPLLRQKVSLGPTGIGIGGRHAGIWVGLPFMEWARYRSAVREVVDEATESVVNVSGMHR